MGISAGNLYRMGGEPVPDVPRGPVGWQEPGAQNSSGAFHSVNFGTGHGELPQCYNYLISNTCTNKYKTLKKCYNFKSKIERENPISTDYSG